MGVLGNPTHEKFAQEFHRLVWTGTKASTARTQAYLDAGYDNTAGFAKDNARKLAQRPEIKARLIELSENAEFLACTDAAWAMRTLKRRVELIDAFNLDDYLTPRRDGQPRGFDISTATRKQLARLGELSLEEEHKLVGAKEDPDTIVVRKTKLKGLLDITAPILAMAKIAGWLAPEKQVHSGGLTLETLVSQSFEKSPEPKKIEAA